MGARFIGYSIYLRSTSWLTYVIFLNKFRGRSSRFFDMAWLGYHCMKQIISVVAIGAPNNFIKIILTLISFSYMNRWQLQELLHDWNICSFRFQLLHRRCWLFLKSKLNSWIFICFWNQLAFFKLSWLLIYNVLLFNKKVVDCSFTKPWRCSTIQFVSSLGTWYSRLLTIFEILSLRDSDCNHLTSRSKPMKPILFFETFGSFCDTLVKWVFRSSFVLNILINLIWFIVIILLPSVIVFRGNYIGLAEKIAEVTYFTLIFSE